jgi:uroporphyrinogen decarboxylase
MAELLLDLHDYPDLMASLYDTTWHYEERLLQAFLDSPSEVCFYDICWATGARMGPKLFEKWVGPEIRRAVDFVHQQPGKYIGFYTLGRIRELLPVMVDTGVDFIETFEPNEGDITLAEAKRLYGKRTCLMGNFDCLVLARGTREQARQETLRCLREGMDGGGYVLVTADEVPADAQLDNLRVMVETADHYGRY